MKLTTATIQYKCVKNKTCISDKHLIPMKNMCPNLHCKRPNSLSTHGHNCWLVIPIVLLIYSILDEKRGLACAIILKYSVYEENKHECVFNGSQLAKMKKSIPDMSLPITAIKCIGMKHHHHHHHHHPSAAEQATTRFLHARRSSANVAICCSCIAP